MLNDDISTLLRTAIEAARSGDRGAARATLHRVIAQDPDNETAWLWLVTVADSDEERLQSLRRVLTINPRNERARQALGRLEQQLRVTPSRTQTRRPVPLATAERGALLSAPRRRRGLPPWVFWTLALIALGLVAAGLTLLYLDMQKDSDAPPPPPTSQRPTQSAAIQAGGYVSPTPVGGALRTLPPRETFPPTWTPTATWTPSPTPLPSPTPPPLSDYTMLVSALRGGRGWALHTLTADGSSERALTFTLPPDSSTVLSLVEVYDAAYSPDGKQVAFTARLSQSRLEGEVLVSQEFEDLFVAPSGGGTMRRLTTFAAPRVADAAWSPDGQTIACAANPDGTFDLFLVSVETGAVETLTPGQSEDREPAWSPDGQWIAFTSDRSGPGATEIWRINVDSGALKQLTDNVNSSFSAAWSPDGSAIVFLSDRRGATDLYLMTANGDGERGLLVADVRAEERDPAWSPDGRWIAFSSNRERSIFDLYVVRPDGSELQRILSSDGDTRYVTWHPASQ
ncbi:MAG: hypothetical protein OZ934_01400 [Anaerolineae bacterium]|nr:hypothetical protein [Anaerolineae bacterium]